MKTSRRRPRRALAVVAALTALAFVSQSTAYAEGSKYSDWAPRPDPASGVPYSLLDGPLPDQLFGELDACPDAGAFESDIVPFCVKVKVTDGEIKLGNTVAHVDPFEVVVAIGTQEDETGASTMVLVPGTGDGVGGPAAVPISGGVLGVPALDPLIQAEPLGLLSLSVTPRVGSPGLVGQPGDDPLTTGLQFSRWVQGIYEGPVTFNVPMAIQVNNLLLGETCEIGQFELNLTTGTTNPPTGVEPMSGANGVAWQTVWYRDGYPPANPWFPGPTFPLMIHEGATVVDNAFAVPGAADCGVGGVGKAINDLGLSALNPFDTVVNSQAGLPSPAGSNYAKFTIDTLLTSYNTGSGLGSPWYLEDPRHDS